MRRAIGFGLVMFAACGGSRSAPVGHPTPAPAAVSSDAAHTAEESRCSDYQLRVPAGALPIYGPPLGCHLPPSPAEQFTTLLQRQRPWLNECFAGVGIRDATATVLISGEGAIEEIVVEPFRAGRCLSGLRDAQLPALGCRWQRHIDFNGLITR